MIERPQPRGRTVLRASIALSARFIHDAGAEGTPVKVTDPHAVQALERAFLRVLSSKGEPHLVQVPKDVAQALLQPKTPEPDGERFYLAVGLDRLGRGAFLLRPSPARSGDALTPSRCPVGERMLADLRAYLQSVTAPASVSE